MPDRRDDAGTDTAPVVTLTWVKSARDGQEHLVEARVRSTVESEGPDQPWPALCGHATVPRDATGQVPGPRCFTCLLLRLTPVEQPAVDKHS